jgi:hypothetical protein
MSRKNNQYTSITIEDDDPLNIMNHSSSLLEDDKASFLMEDDDNFLTNGVLGEEELIALSSPESSQDAGSPATPPHELYNILQNITTQPHASPQTHRHVKSTEILPFGYIDLHGTMFTPPVMQNFYQPQQQQLECFPMMTPMQDYSSYFQPHPIVQPPKLPNSQIKSEKLSPQVSVTESYDSDESEDSHKGDEPPKKRRKRKNDEIDGDNERLSELCNIPNGQLTEEEKQEKRRLRNRQTAQRSRNNQKSRLDTLERENTELKKKNTKITQQLEESQRQCEALRKDNQKLRDQLRKNVIIDVPPIPPPAQPMIRTPAKVTMLMALVFCIGCTFFIGNMLGDRDLLRTSTASVAHSVLQAKPAAVSTPAAPPVDERKNPAGRSILHVKNDTEYCGLGEGMCFDGKQKASDDFEDGQMELPTQAYSFEFDGTGMVKKNIYYPTKMKRHFGLRDHDQEKDSAVAAKPEKETAVPANELVVPAQVKKDPLNIDHNNKQLIRLTEDSFYAKMREKKHKYSMGSIYEFPSPIEENEQYDEDDKKTIHLFCPFIYPMLPTDGDHHDDAFAGLGAGIDEDTRIKLHVPVQILNKTTNTSIIRIAEITGENMSLSESYFELDAALAPVRSEGSPINSADHE